MKKKFIQYSQSLINTLILFIKKIDDNLYFCVNYQEFNKIIIKNWYSFLLINEILNKVRKMKFFSIFNMCDEFNFLWVIAKNEWKTIFQCKYKYFEYNIILFKFYNASNFFQYFMNNVFRNYLNDFIIIYINDLLIFSNTLKEYKYHIHLIFKKLCKIDFYLKSQKY